MRRELSAERRAHSFSQPLWFAGPKNPIGKKRRKKFDREKLASFGPLCLSSDSTRCQESESLSDLKNRRAIRPDLKLPFWTLYFRHYEVGAPCRRAYVWLVYGSCVATCRPDRVRLVRYTSARGGWPNSSDSVGLCRTLSDEDVTAHATRQTCTL